MPDEAVHVSESEAYEALIQIAGRRTFPVPADMIVRHVLALPGTWDWPVRGAALEALLRRFASARAHEIAVVDGPGNNPWGRYRLGRAEAEGMLPYDVRLFSVVPVRGSCDCADFLRGALGLCKHLAAVLMHLAAKARVFARLVKTLPQPAPPFTLVWDAAVPQSDGSDPLEALRLTMPSDRGVAAHVAPALASLFGAPEGGERRLKTTYPGNPEERRRLIEALSAKGRGGRAFADPAARAVLAEEGDRVGRLLRLKAATAALRQGVARAKRRLYSYQKEGVRRILAQGRLVLADDMGLGKTTQAVVAASALYDAGLVRRGLFVVPASLKPQWEREWQAVSAGPLQVVEGGAEARRELYASVRRGFLVTNYEQVVRDVSAISAWAPDLVVLDEAQRIKNWATKTALTIKRLKPEYRLVLTGTPMENRLEELASIVEWVDDRALEPKWRLVPWHSVYADGKREVAGARNLDGLRARLAPVLLRRVRAEVLAQLPARQDTVVSVDLTGRQREAHDELNQPIAQLARVAQRRPLAPPEFLRLMSLLASQRMIANGMGLVEFEAHWPVVRNREPTAEFVDSLAAPKLAELRELVSSLVLVQDRKVVVFSQWRRMLELAAWSVSDLLTGAGRRALFFTGQEGPRRRTQNLVDFHDDPRASVLFLTDAGGVGLNLQKAASACINLELPWNPAVLEQRIGRIHRLGQSRPIDVYNLVSRSCIEERIAGLVSDKRALFKGLFEGTSDDLRFDRQRSLLNLIEGVAEPVVPGTAAAPGEEEGVDDPGDGAAFEESGQEAPAAVGTAVFDAALPVGNPPSRPPSVDVVGGDIGQLFSALTVERLASGRLRVEAPPEAARALMSLFEGMARLMATAAEPTAPSAHGNGSREVAPRA